MFHPNTGEVRSDGADGIACWFIDTDYNEESFFVRHAYFLGANDPYDALKTTLKAEINEDAWAIAEQRHLARLSDKPKSGRIAVKVINHLGDEVMKVFKVTSIMEFLIADTFTDSLAQAHRPTSRKPSRPPRSICRRIRSIRACNSTSSIARKIRASGRCEAAAICA